MEEYLNDKDFEINRRQYVAEKEAKKAGGKPTNGLSKLSETRSAAAKTSTPQPAQMPSKPANNNAPLIDLFESIQDNQQTMAQPTVSMQQYPQQTGFQQPGFQVPQQTAPMGMQQQPPQQQQFSQPMGVQTTNPFLQMQQQQQQMQQQPQVPQPSLQTQFTGAGFGGYTPQPFSPQSPSLSSIPQNGVANFSQQQPSLQLAPISELPSQPSFQQQPGMPAELSSQSPLQPQPTSTNPFRQSMMAPPTNTGLPEQKMLQNPTGAIPTLTRSPTNPFGRNNFSNPQQQQQQPSLSTSPFSPLPTIHQSQQTTTSPFAPQQMPQPTGTNPFARNTSSPLHNPNLASSPPPVAGGLTVHATGSTNPFRQSAFVNSQTGQGWQNAPPAQQSTLGGMSIESLGTVGVFPRPGAQQQQQQGQNGGQGWS